MNVAKNDPAACAAHRLNNKLPVFKTDEEIDKVYCNKCVARKTCSLWTARDK
jgi:hypothetical protein